MYFFKYPHNNEKKEAWLGVLHLKTDLFLKKYVYLFACMSVCVCVRHRMHVEVRGQLVSASSCLPQLGYWE